MAKHQVAIRGELNSPAAAERHTACVIDIAAGKVVTYAPGVSLTGIRSPNGLTRLPVT